MKKINGLNKNYFSPLKRKFFVKKNFLSFVTLKNEKQKDYFLKNYFLSFYVQVAHRGKIIYFVISPHPPTAELFES